MLKFNILKGFFFKVNECVLLFVPVFPEVFRKRNHALLLFIPKFVKHATQALDEGDFIRHLIENRIFLMATR